MNDIWEKIQEFYDNNPTLFGVLIFIDFAILYMIIQYFFN